MLVTEVVVGGDRSRSGNAVGVVGDGDHLSLVDDIVIVDDGTTIVVVVGGNGQTASHQGCGDESVTHDEERSTLDADVD